MADWLLVQVVVLSLGTILILLSLLLTTYRALRHWREAARHYARLFVDARTYQNKLLDLLIAERTRFRGDDCDDSDDADWWKHPEDSPES